MKRFLKYPHYFIRWMKLSSSSFTEIFPTLKSLGRRENKGAGSGFSQTQPHPPDTGEHPGIYIKLKINIIVDSYKLLGLHLNNKL